jgi:hypothetical protein
VLAFRALQQANPKQRFAFPFMNPPARARGWSFQRSVLEDLAPYFGFTTFSLRESKVEPDNCGSHARC